MLDQICIKTLIKMIERGDSYTLDEFMNDLPCGRDTTMSPLDLFKIYSDQIRDIETYRPGAGLSQSEIVKKFAIKSAKELAAFHKISREAAKMRSSRHKLGALMKANREK